MTRYFFLLIIFFPLRINAQTITVFKHANTLNNKVIDVEPQFPGGNKAFYKYITSNVEFAPNANRKDLTGKVTISMAIEPDGSITDVKVVKGYSVLIDRETVRVISESPKWKPGLAHGTPIKVRYTFSVNYAFSAGKG